MHVACTVACAVSDWVPLIAASLGTRHRPDFTMSYTCIGMRCNLAFKGQTIPSLQRLSTRCRVVAAAANAAGQGDHGLTLKVLSRLPDIVCKLNVLFIPRMSGGVHAAPGGTLSHQR